MIHSGAPIKIGSKAAAGIKKGMPVSIKDVSGVDTLVPYTSTDNKFVGVALEDNYEFDSMVEGSNAPTVPSVVTKTPIVECSSITFLVPISAANSKGISSLDHGVFTILGTSFSK